MVGRSPKRQATGWRAVYSVMATTRSGSTSPSSAWSEMVLSETIRW